MGILTRYIVLGILKVLFPLWIALGMMIVFFEWLTYVFKWDASALTITYTLALKIPSYLQLVFPIACLFSCLAVLGAMNRSREIVAAQSLGVLNQRIFTACFLALLIASVPFYFLTHYISPISTKQHHVFIDTKIKNRVSRFAKIIDRKIWQRQGNYIYNIDYYDDEKQELVGVTIYLFDQNFRLIETTSAKRAEWLNDQWVLFSGQVISNQGDDNEIEIFPFQSLTTTVIDKPRSITRIDYSPDSMTQGELSSAIARLQQIGVDSTKLKVIQNSRWSFLFIAFLFLYLSFPKMVVFSRKSSMAKDGTYVAGISLLYWMLYTFGINLGNKGKISPFLAAWLPTLAFFGIMYFINQRKGLKQMSD